MLRCFESEHNTTHAVAAASAVGRFEQSVHREITHSGGTHLHHMRHNVMLFDL